jgi:hypothetical protein
MDIVPMIGVTAQTPNGPKSVNIEWVQKFTDWLEQVKDDAKQITGFIAVYQGETKTVDGHGKRTDPTLNNVEKALLWRDSLLPQCDLYQALRCWVSERHKSSKGG